MRRPTHPTSRPLRSSRVGLWGLLLAALALALPQTTEARARKGGRRLARAAKPAPAKVGRYLRANSARRDPRKEISYASFNVQNLFRYRPRPGTETSGNKRDRKVAKRANYLPKNRQEYVDKVQRLAKEIIKLGKPDLVSLQEIENFKRTKRRDHSVLADLVKEIKAQTAGKGDVQYDFAFSHGVSDRRGISNAFLYRTDRVKLDAPDAKDPLLGDRKQFREKLSLNVKVANPKSLNGHASEKVKADMNGNLTLARPLLVGRFTVYKNGVAAGGPSETLYVFNNHLKSQPHRFQERRREQSKLMTKELSRLLKAQPKAKVLLSGDMNVDLNQPGHVAQLRTLQNTTPANAKTPTLLENLTSKMKEADRFSYKYRNKLELLDWVFASPNLAKKLIEVRIPHVNTLATDAAKRSSDHDPVLTRFAAFE